LHPNLLTHSLFLAHTTLVFKRTEHGMGRSRGRYLTTDEVAERFRLNPDTLRVWRSQGRGPRWIKPGKNVLYSEAEIERWERQLEREAAAAGAGDAA
jgi:transposase-like protein